MYIQLHLFKSYNTDISDAVFELGVIGDAPTPTVQWEDKI